MSSVGFKVKTPIPVKTNTTIIPQNPNSLISFLDDSKNVDFQYSSISSQRDVKPKAGFSVSKTNGALVDYM